MTQETHPNKELAESPLYPHQTGDGEVSPGDLEQHYDAHPEMYHPGLAPHISNVLGKAGVSGSHGQDDQLEIDATSETQPPELSPEQIIGILRNYKESDTEFTSVEASQLIEAGGGDSVAAHLDKFSGLDHQAIASQLIEARHRRSVAYNLDKFSGLDTTIASQLIEAGGGDSVAAHLDKFSGLDHQAIASQIIEKGYFINVIQNAAKFSNLDLGDLLISHQAELATNPDVADSVVENFSSLGLSGQEAHDVLAACSKNYSTAQKVKQLDLESFISADLAQTFLNQTGNLKVPLKGIVKDHNPYQATAGTMEFVTSTVPGSEIHKKASRMSRALREADQTKNGEVAGLAASTRQAFDDLKQQLGSQYGQEYADQLFGPAGRAGDMWPTYRRLVADYLVLDEKDGDTPENLEKVLAEAGKAFEQVLQVDTKYYDKLFTEWDAKRMGQREFQEVFLGRDGVYAYIGRRAQMWARQKKLGLKRSDNLKAEAVDLPTYLVYPRGFRDAMPSETKAAYLRQDIKDPNAAHYYDTGFTGTIPQDIMNILGMPEQSWDERIRLLSASKRDRTVLGLEGSKDERDQVVNTVEYHVKDEQTAAGLYTVGEGDSERLVPYAQPTEPSERLAFRMSQLALHRHYYAQELASTRETRSRLDRHTLDGNAEMRVDNSLSPELVQKLQDVFNVEDIGASLLEHATALKIAEKDGPYPDEAVFEMKIPGVDEVIVKNIVRSKQQGPVDEFEALLLLKQLGIPAPRPIARIFTEGQKGLIVMEKLSGVSGRVLKDYFNDNELTTEQQSSILQQAQQRMEEIAQTVRSDTGLDKPWRLKDFMISFENDEAGQPRIAQMLPIDFERAKVFDSNNPHSVKLGQDLDVAFEIEPENE